MSEKSIPLRTGFVFGLLLLVTSGPACAGRLLDFIRDYDLNDYALGMKYSVSQNPFAGAENSTIVYPYLTAFHHSAFTDDWFLILHDNIGVRHVSENDWEVGVFGRIQTLGFGSGDNDEVAGLEERSWTIEAGPFIGWRRWPVHIQLRSYLDVANRNNSATAELEFSLPRKFERGFFVPSIQLTYMTDDYSNYYFGVSQLESTPTRPAYQPGAVTNAWIGFQLAYELTPKWLLSTTMGIEFLDSAVTASPIVDSDTLWSVGIGLAYNANVFQPREWEGDAPPQKFEMRVTAFSSTIDTKIVRDAFDGQLGGEVDLEDFLGISDQETIFQIDTLFRFGYFHRLELGYFELRRRSMTTLERDITFGDQTFVAGTEVETSMQTVILRLAYSYSLIRDQQKELGVSIGLSSSRFESKLSVQSTQQSESINVNLPLPTFGLFASVTLGSKWQIKADIDVFALDFDRYDGHMTYIGFEIEREFGEVFGAGFGYSFYNTRLSAKNEDLRGTLQTSHHGPKLYLIATF